LGWFWKQLLGVFPGKSEDYARSKIGYRKARHTSVYNLIAPEKLIEEPVLRDTDRIVTIADRMGE
jgi:hypothetical protein